METRSIGLFCSCRTEFVGLTRMRCRARKRWLSVDNKKLETTKINSDIIYYEGDWIETLYNLFTQKKSHEHAQPNAPETNKDIPTNPRPHPTPKHFPLSPKLPSALSNSIPTATSPIRSQSDERQRYLRTM